MASMSAFPADSASIMRLRAAAVCLHFPISEDAIRRGFDTVKVKGRVEPVPVPGNYTLLIDYAHNALSMENILTTLREYHPQSPDVHVRRGRKPCPLAPL